MQFSYLAPGAKSFRTYPVDTPPPVPPGHTRVVCISDTHNEHTKIVLPPGHVLIHAGDVLTESGKRHVERNPDKSIRRVKSEGIALFSNFATWFRSQPHPHKVLIAGNHDLVMEGIGRAEIQRLVGPATAYLLHEHAVLVGGIKEGAALKVFGSPFARWGGQNDAFFSPRGHDFTLMEPDTHILVTHMPPVLPDSEGNNREDRNIVSNMHKANTLLSISGHCHWAHGVYFTSQKQTPCVVVSTCDSNWQFDIGNLNKPRGDASDALYGGYDLGFPVVVCDLPIPPVASDAQWSIGGAAVGLSPSLPEQRKAKPSLVVFGEMALPALLMEEAFHVIKFVREEEACAFFASRSSPQVAVCVTKLGSEGNSVTKVMMRALRQSEAGIGAYLVINSYTAAITHPEMQHGLDCEFSVDQYTANDEELSDLLSRLAKGERPVRALFPTGAIKPPPHMLFFGPPTDPDFVTRLLPVFSAMPFTVHHFDEVTEANEFIRNTSDDISVCVAKLGSKGNLGVDVMRSLREKFPNAFLIVHSATAFAKKSTQDKLLQHVHVDLFVDHSCEPRMLEALCGKLK